MMIYLQMIETPEDSSKFEELYETYRGLMYHVALRRLRDPHDAEDAVHYAFVKIAEHIKKIDPPCPKTKSLFVTIVDNRVTDILRKKGLRLELLFDDAMEQPVITETHSDHRLSECIMHLPPQYRTVIWLKYYHGYSLREIAGIMDISLVNAQKIDQRAKQRLWKDYQKGGGKL